jgi:hypothetical protein
LQAENYFILKKTSERPTRFKASLGVVVSRSPSRQLFKLYPLFWASQEKFKVFFALCRIGVMFYLLIERRYYERPSNHGTCRKSKDANQTHQPSQSKTEGFTRQRHYKVYTSAGTQADRGRKNVGAEINFLPFLIA